VAVPSPAYAPHTGPARFDPYAPEALATAPTALDSFLALLAVIDRTVLPRIIAVESPAAQFQLDIAGGGLILLPRAHNAYASDDTLSVEAPKAARALNKRPQAARKAIDTLTPARDAILRCAARDLWAFAGTGSIQHRVSPADGVGIAGLNFDASELYAAARDQALPAVPGPVSAFYTEIKPRAQSGWHAARSGWVHEASNAMPGDQMLRSLADIARAARGYAAWMDRVEPIKGASLSFLSGTGHKVITCAAVDGADIAVLNLSPTAWAGALQSWDMICAGHAVEAEPREGTQSM